MTRSTTKAVCKDHTTTNPCNGCRADHLAGDHAGASHRATCRPCRAEARAVRPDATPSDLQRPSRALPDVAALAANDTDLIEE